MNGIHDMGGLQDMGPVVREENEPVFHEVWEGRIYALKRAMRAWSKWSLDTDRYMVELLPPADYLKMSYYERWAVCLESLLLEHGFVTKEELATGKSRSGTPKAVPRLTRAMASTFLSRGIASSEDAGVVPLFKEGQCVRARNIHPREHTRLPRYARGKTGTIARDHGVYLFPDTHAHYLGEKRQHVYSVRFTARELWGESASPADSVYIDLWDDYLELA